MRRLGNWPLVGALLAITLVAYLPLWNNDFVTLDDEAYITRNPAVQVGWSAPAMRWAWTTYRGSYWQPLSWLSLQGDVELFCSRAPDGSPNLSARVFHLHNLLWHEASVALLFGVLWRMTGARWRSFFAAALFGLHPLRVESVAWAAERKDVLSCFFGILSLWFYVSYVARPHWTRYLGAVLAFLVSLLCKPMLMTFPFVLLLVDYWPLRRLALSAPEPRLARLGRLLREKIPFFLLTAGIMVVTLRARHETWPGVTYADLPLFDRLAVAVIGYGWYLGHSVWPVGLAVLYPHPHHAWSGPAALAGVGVMLAMTAVCFWQARRRPWLVVGWLWFVGCLVPVLGFALAGEQAWADRFTYWPHIGFCLAAVWGVGELVARLRFRPPVVAVAGGIVLGCLMGLTWMQVRCWHDTVTLWDQAFAVTTDNYKAHECMGIYYQEHGQPDLAARHFAAAVDIHPRSPIYRYFLGNVLAELGEYREAEKQLNEAVAIDPEFFPARQALFQVQSHR